MKTITDEEFKKVGQMVDKLMKDILTICEGNVLMAPVVFSIAAGEATALSGGRLSSVLGLVTESYERMIVGLHSMPDISNDPVLLEQVIDEAIKLNPSLNKEKLMEKLSTKPSNPELDALFDKIPKKDPVN